MWFNPLFEPAVLLGRDAAGARFAAADDLVPTPGPARPENGGTGTPGGVDRGSSEDEVDPRHRDLLTPRLAALLSGSEPVAAGLLLPPADGTDTSNHERLGTRVPRDETAFGVIGHGDMSTAAIDGPGGRSITPDELADLLRLSPIYPGAPVRLFSCGTAIGHGGQPSFAERLAARLGLPVYAPRGHLYANSTSTVVVDRDHPGNRPVVDDPAWVRFDPIPNPDGTTRVEATTEDPHWQPGGYRPATRSAASTMTRWSSAPAPAAGLHLQEDPGAPTGDVAPAEPQVVDAVTLVAPPYLRQPDPAVGAGHFVDLRPRGAGEPARGGDHPLRDALARTLQDQGGLGEGAATAAADGLIGLTLHATQGSALHRLLDGGVTVTVQEGRSRVVVSVDAEFVGDDNASYVPPDRSWQPDGPPDEGPGTEPGNERRSRLGESGLIVHDHEITSSSGRAWAHNGGLAVNPRFTFGVDPANRATSIQVGFDLSLGGGHTATTRTETMASHLRLAEGPGVWAHFQRPMQLRLSISRPSQAHPESAHLPVVGQFAYPQATLDRLVGVAPPLRRVAAEGVGGLAFAVESFSGLAEVRTRVLRELARLATGADATAQVQQTALDALHQAGHPAGRRVRATISETVLLSMFGQALSGSLVSPAFEVPVRAPGGLTRQAKVALVVAVDLEQVTPHDSAEMSLTSENKAQVRVGRNVASSDRRSGGASLQGEFATRPGASIGLERGGSLAGGVTRRTSVSTEHASAAVGFPKRSVKHPAGTTTRADMRGTMRVTIVPEGLHHDPTEVTGGVRLFLRGRADLLDLLTEQHEIVQAGDRLPLIPPGGGLGPAHVEHLVGAERVLPRIVATLGLDSPESTRRLVDVDMRRKLAGRFALNGLLARAQSLFGPGVSAVVSRTSGLVTEEFLVEVRARHEGPARASRVDSVSYSQSQEGWDWSDHTTTTAAGTDLGATGAGTIGWGGTRGEAAEPGRAFRAGPSAGVEGSWTRESAVTSGAWGAHDDSDSYSGPAWQVDQAVDYTVRIRRRTVPHAPHPPGGYSTAAVTSRSPQEVDVPVEGDGHLRGWSRTVVPEPFTATRVAVDDAGWAEPQVRSREEAGLDPAAALLTPGERAKWVGGSTALRTALADALADAGVHGVSWETRTALDALTSPEFLETRFADFRAPDGRQVSLTDDGPTNRRQLDILLRAIPHDAVPTGEQGPFTTGVSSDAWSKVVLRQRSSSAVSGRVGASLTVLADQDVTPADVAAEPGEPEAAAPAAAPETSNRRTTTFPALDARGRREGSTGTLDLQLARGGMKVSEDADHEVRRTAVRWVAEVSVVPEGRLARLFGRSQGRQVVDVPVGLLTIRPVGAADPAGPVEGPAAAPRPALPAATLSGLAVTRSLHPAPTAGEDAPGADRPAGPEPVVTRVQDLLSEAAPWALGTVTGGASGFARDIAPFLTLRSLAGYGDTLRASGLPLSTSRAGWFADQTVTVLLRADRHGDARPVGLGDLSPATQEKHYLRVGLVQSRSSTGGAGRFELGGSAAGQVSAADLLLRDVAPGLAGSGERVRNLEGNRGPVDAREHRVTHAGPSLDHEIDLELTVEVTVTTTPALRAPLVGLPFADTTTAVPAGPLGLVERVSVPEPVLGDARPDPTAPVTPDDPGAGGPTGDVVLVVDPHRRLQRMEPGAAPAPRPLTVTPRHLRSVHAGVVQVDPDVVRDLFEQVARLVGDRRRHGRPAAAPGPRVTSGTTSGGTHPQHPRLDQGTAVGAPAEGAAPADPRETPADPRARNTMRPGTTAHDVARQVVGAPGIAAFLDQMLAEQGHRLDVLQRQDWAHLLGIGSLVAPVDVAVELRAELFDAQPLGWFAGSLNSVTIFVDSHESNTDGTTTTSATVTPAPVTVAMEDPAPQGRGEHTFGARGSVSTATGSTATAGANTSESRVPIQVRSGWLLRVSTGLQLTATLVSQRAGWVGSAPDTTSATFRAAAAVELVLSPDMARQLGILVADGAGPAAGHQPARPVPPAPLDPRWFQPPYTVLPSAAPGAAVAYDSQPLHHVGERDVTAVHVQDDGHVQYRGRTFARHTVGAALTPDRSPGRPPLVLVHSGAGSPPATTLTALADGLTTHLGADVSVAVPRGRTPRAGWTLHDRDGQGQHVTDLREHLARSVDQHLADAAQAHDAATDARDQALARRNQADRNATAAENEHRSAADGVRRATTALNAAEAETGLAAAARAEAEERRNSATARHEAAAAAASDAGSALEARRGELDAARQEAERLRQTLTQADAAWQHAREGVVTTLTALAVARAIEQQTPSPEATGARESAEQAYDDAGRHERELALAYDTAGRDATAAADRVPRIAAAASAARDQAETTARAADTAARAARTATETADRARTRHDEASEAHRDARHVDTQARDRLRTAETAATAARREAARAGDDLTAAEHHLTEIDARRTQATQVRDRVTRGRADHPPDVHHGLADDRGPDGGAGPSGAVPGSESDPPSGWHDNLAYGRDAPEGTGEPHSAPITADSVASLPAGLLLRSQPPGQEGQSSPDVDVAGRPAAADDLTAARAIAATPGVLTVVAHADEAGHLVVGGSRRTAEAVAEAIRATDEWRRDPGRPVRLLACRTGHGGADSTAAALARALGVPVSAPTDHVWTGPELAEGVLVTGTDAATHLPLRPATGEMQTFEVDPLPPHALQVRREPGTGEAPPVTHRPDTHSAAPALSRWTADRGPGPAGPRTVLPPTAVDQPQAPVAYPSAADLQHLATYPIYDIGLPPNVESGLLGPGVLTGLRATDRQRAGDGTGVGAALADIVGGSELFHDALSPPQRRALALALGGAVDEGRGGAHRLYDGGVTVPVPELPGVTVSVGLGPARGTGEVTSPQAAGDDRSGTTRSVVLVGESTGSTALAMQGTGSLVGGASVTLPGPVGVALSLRLGVRGVRRSGIGHVVRNEFNYVSSSPGTWTHFRVPATLTVVLRHGNQGERTDRVPVDTDLAFPRSATVGSLGAGVAERARALPRSESIDTALDRAGHPLGGRRSRSARPPFGSGDLGTAPALASGSGRDRPPGSRPASPSPSGTTTGDLHVPRTIAEDEHPATDPRLAVTGAGGLFGVPESMNLQRVRARVLDQLANLADAGRDARSAYDLPGDPVGSAVRDFLSEATVLPLLSQYTSSGVVSQPVPVRHRGRRGSVEVRLHVSVRLGALTFVDTAEAALAVKGEHHVGTLAPASSSDGALAGVAVPVNLPLGGDPAPTFGEERWGRFTGAGTGELTWSRNTGTTTSSLPRRSLSYSGPSTRYASAATVTVRLVSPWVGVSPPVEEPAETYLRVRSQDAWLFEGALGSVPGATAPPRPAPSAAEPEDERDLPHGGARGGGLGPALVEHLGGADQVVKRIEQLLGDRASDPAVRSRLAASFSTRALLGLAPSLFGPGVTESWTTLDSRTETETVVSVHARLGDRLGSGRAATGTVDLGVEQLTSADTGFGQEVSGTGDLDLSFVGGAERVSVGVSVRYSGRYRRTWALGSSAQRATDWAVSYTGPVRTFDHSLSFDIEIRTVRRPYSPAPTTAVRRLLGAAAGAVGWSVPAGTGPEVRLGPDQAALTGWVRLSVPEPLTPALGRTVAHPAPQILPEAPRIDAEPLLPDDQALSVGGSAELTEAVLAVLADVGVPVASEAVRAELATLVAPELLLGNVRHLVPGRNFDLALPSVTGPRRVTLTLSLDLHRITPTDVPGERGTYTFGLGTDGWTREAGRQTVTTSHTGGAGGTLGLSGRGGTLPPVPEAPAPSPAEPPATPTQPAAAPRAAPDPAPRPERRRPTHAIWGSGAATWNRTTGRGRVMASAERLKTWRQAEATPHTGDALWKVTATVAPGRLRLLTPGRATTATRHVSVPGGVSLLRPVNPAPGTSGPGPDLTAVREDESAQDEPTVGPPPTQLPAAGMSSLAVPVALRPAAGGRTVADQVHGLLVAHLPEALVADGTPSGGLPSWLGPFLTPDALRDQLDAILGNGAVLSTVLPGAFFDRTVEVRVTGNRVGDASRTTGTEPVIERQVRQAYLRERRQLPSGRSADGHWAAGGGGAPSVDTGTGTAWVQVAGQGSGGSGNIEEALERFDSTFTHNGPSVRYDSTLQVHAAVRVTWTPTLRTLGLGALAQLVIPTRPGDPDHPHADVELIETRTAPLGALTRTGAEPVPGQAGPTGGPVDVVVDDAGTALPPPAFGDGSAGLVGLSPDVARWIVDTLTDLRERSAGIGASVTDRAPGSLSRLVNPATLLAHVEQLLSPQGYTLEDVADHTDRQGRTWTPVVRAGLRWTTSLGWLAGTLSVTRGLPAAVDISTNHGQGPSVSGGGGPGARLESTNPPADAYNRPWTTATVGTVGRLGDFASTGNHFGGRTEAVDSVGWFLRGTAQLEVGVSLVASGDQRRPHPSVESRTAVFPDAAEVVLSGQAAQLAGLDTSRSPVPNTWVVPPWGSDRGAAAGPALALVGRTRLAAVHVDGRGFVEFRRRVFDAGQLATELRRHLPGGEHEGLLLVITVPGASPAAAGNLARQVGEGLAHPVGVAVPLGTHEDTRWAVHGPDGKSVTTPGRLDAWLAEAHPSERPAPSSPSELSGPSSPSERPGPSDRPESGGDALPGLNVATRPVALHAPEDDVIRWTSQGFGLDDAAPADRDAGRRADPQTRSLEIEAASGDILRSRGAGGAPSGHDSDSDSDSDSGYDSSHDSDSGYEADAETETRTPPDHLDRLAPRTSFLGGRTWARVRLDLSAPPDPADVRALRAALPRDDAGSPLLHPDPRLGWPAAVNRHGPGTRRDAHRGGDAPRRHAENCVDAALSALATWFGEPSAAGRVRFEQTPDVLDDFLLDAVGHPLPLLAEADTAGAEKVAAPVRDLGHGAAALVAVRGGTWAHVVAAVNHGGEVVWMDPQTGGVGDSLDHLGLPADDARTMSALHFTPDGVPVEPYGPDAPHERWSQEPEAPGAPPRRHDGWAWSEDEQGISFADGSLVPAEGWALAGGSLVRPDSALVLDPLTGELRTDSERARALTAGDLRTVAGADVAAVVTSREARDDAAVDEIPEAVGGYWSGNYFVEPRELTAEQREALAALGRLPLATTADGDSYLHAVLGTALAGLPRSPLTDEVDAPAVADWREAFARAYEAGAADIADVVPADVHREAPAHLRAGTAPQAVTDLFPYLTDDVPGLRVVVIAQDGQAYEVGDRDLPPQYVVHLGDAYAATIRVPPTDDEEKPWL